MSLCVRQKLQLNLLTIASACYFPADNDGMSIHAGSCMFGNLDANKGTGWDIAALSDKDPDYAGSCGRCYEVACRPSTITDGYGNSLDRTGTCTGEKSVIVMVTDTCPCYYPGNAASNTRWCCGDNYHMDLSQWAFEKLGTTGAGVMGIYYKPVPCPSSPSAAAAASSSSSSSSSSDEGENFSSSSSSSDSSSSSSSGGSWSTDGQSWSNDGGDSWSSSGGSWSNSGGSSLSPSPSPSSSGSGSSPSPSPSSSPSPSASPSPYNSYNSPSPSPYNSYNNPSPSPSPSSSSGGSSSSSGGSWSSWGDAWKQGYSQATSYGGGSWSPEWPNRGLRKLRGFLAGAAADAGANVVGNKGSGEASSTVMEEGIVTAWA
eukprot:GHRR01016726.1.p1 GENE.GHRR01016726.1~~GHRR01016726.1.p1  ORF type:complete len:373 (+),score=77.90 GHRR01016726.1:674-1792(+)